MVQIPASECFSYSFMTSFVNIGNIYFLLNNNLHWPKIVKYVGNINWATTKFCASQTVNQPLQ